MIPQYVVVCSNNLLVRRGLVDILSHYSAQLHIRTAQNGKEALSLLNEEMSYLVLLEIASGLDGVETLLFLRRYWPTVPTIPFSTQIDKEEDHRKTIVDIPYHTFGHDEDGVLQDIVLNALQSSFKKHSALKYHQISISLEATKQKDYSVQLNTKEKEILNLICKQYNSREIADILNIKKRTVEGYRNNLLNKLNAKNSVGLAISAVKYGFFKL